MNAKLIASDKFTRRIYNVEYEGRIYQAVIYENEQGLWDEATISLDGQVLGIEGIEGEIYEAVTAYIDEHYDNLLQEALKNT